MSMKQTKLWTINFFLLVLGQIISLFGNGILRFALPLYLLDVTGSSTLFGLVTGVALVPLIFLTPVGGLLADRLNKRNIMVCLDFLTAALIFAFLSVFSDAQIIPQLVFTLMVLYGISGLYEPAVQSSLPILLGEEVLTQGNGIIFSVNSLATMLSPLIGGFLYGIYGLVPILVISIVCFVFSAVMELFLKIPHTKQEYSESVMKTAVDDLKLSFHYMTKEKKIIVKMVLIACILNATVISMGLIALPVLITDRLQFSTEIYGMAQACAGVGGLCGGIFVSVFGNKLHINKMYQFFNGQTVILIPLAISMHFLSTPKISLLMIVCSTFCLMFIETVVSVQTMTFVQGEVPEELLGKIMALFLTFCICAQPVGQVIFGFLFDHFIGRETLIILIPIAASIGVTFYAKSIFPTKKNEADQMDSASK
ncbi:MAG: MFS transporter [Bacillota bacterium]